MPHAQCRAVRVMLIAARSRVTVTQIPTIPIEPVPAAGFSGRFQAHCVSRQRPAGDDRRRRRRS